MTTRRQKAAQRANVWTPLKRAHRIPPTAERIAALRAEAARLGVEDDAVDRVLAESGDVWKNGRYQVIVTRSPEGWVDRLSIRREDRAAEPFPWRDLQRIKNQLAGEDAEAVELFPAESRLVDTANQRWLWCFPPGWTAPLGFNTGRIVAGPEEAARVGARQAPFDE